MMGVSTEDGRGNITAYAGVRDNKKVLQRDRDYSACSLDREPDDFVRLRRLGDELPGVLLRRRPTAFSPSTRRPAIRSGRSMTDHRPVQLRSDEPLPASGHALHAWARWATTSSHEAADVYTQLMFTDYESVAQIAPGGNFFDTNTINCDNPLLSAQQLATIGCDAGGDCGWRQRYDVHRAPQRRGRWTPAEIREQLVPRSARCARRNLRELGLRRLGAVLGGRSPISRRTTTSTRHA